MPGRKRNPSSEEDTAGKSAPQDAPPIEDQSASDVSQLIEDQSAPEVASSNDETDVPAAIDMETHDGPGDEPPPPSDFQSFATEGVHHEDKHVGELASEVLQGRWGDFAIARERLINAGHDAASIFTKVNERLMRGAPSAHRATVDQVVDQVQRGEWGDNQNALESRLLGAGYKAVDVADILRKLENS